MKNCKNFNELSNYIGQQIKKFRETSGITRSHIADVLNISRPQIAKYEDGVTRISAASIYLVAQELRRPIEEFFPKDKLSGETKNNDNGVDFGNIANLIYFWEKIKGADQVENLRKLLNSMPNKE